MDLLDRLLPKVGERIGRYELVEVLGRGGFGAVYLARQAGLDAEVAVKVMLPQADDASGQFVARFEREAAVLKTLEHPATLKVRDAGRTSEGLPFLVTEFVRGRALADLIAEGPLPAARVLRIGLQVLASLAEAHHHGIIHRDLKPANIMVRDIIGQADAVKVLDFGIAKVQGDARIQTMTGMAFGTPWYMAPEQVRGEKELDGRLDLYAAGLILAECLCGRRVVEADSLMSAVYAQARPEPLTFDPLVTASALWPVIERAAQKDRERRYPDALTMLDALQQTERLQWAGAGAIAAWPIQPTPSAGAGPGAAPAQPWPPPLPAAQATPAWNAPPAGLAVPSVPTHGTDLAAAGPPLRLAHRPRVVLGVFVSALAAAAAVVWAVGSGGGDSGALEGDPLTAFAGRGSGDAAGLDEPVGADEPEGWRALRRHDFDPSRPPVDLAQPPADALPGDENTRYAWLERGSGSVSPGPTDLLRVDETTWRVTGELLTTSYWDDEAQFYALGDIAPLVAPLVRGMVPGDRLCFWSLQYQVVTELQLLELIPGFAPPPEAASMPDNAVTAADGSRYVVLRPGRDEPVVASDDWLLVHYAQWNESGVFRAATAPGMEEMFSARSLPQVRVGERRLIWASAEQWFPGGNRSDRAQEVYVTDLEVVGLAELRSAPSGAARPPTNAHREPSGVAWEARRLGLGTVRPGPDAWVSVAMDLWTTMGDPVTLRQVDDGPYTTLVGNMSPPFDTLLADMVEGELRRVWLPAGSLGQTEPIVGEIELVRVFWTGPTSNVVGTD